MYADIDPVAVSHAQALLAGSRTAAIRGDVSRPEDILGAPEVRRLIDFRQPTAVLVLAVLHIIPGDADPAGAMARFRAAMAPGSYLVISHADVSPAHVVGTKRLSEEDPRRGGEEGLILGGVVELDPQGATRR